MTVSEQDFHNVRLAWNDFMLGWEYTLNKSVNKSDIEKHMDG